MAGTLRRALALAVVVSSVPLAAHAQVRSRPMSAEVPGTRSMAPAPSARESVINLYGELQSLSAHLQRVHDRALQDPALARARAELTRAVQRAMDATDPEMPRLAARVEQLPREMSAARARGDAARMQAIERELAQIQARYIRVRSAVLNQPAIARQAHAYEEMLRQRMVQIEPLTENLLARTAELQRLLQSALAPQPPQ